MNNSSSALVLEPLFAFLSYSLSTLESTFYKLPGSAVIARYVKSSHQNDPGRTLLELILIIFAIRTLLQSRTRADRTGKHFIQFSEKVSVLCGPPNIVPF
jgi:serine palmitoyltransferase